MGGRQWGGRIGSHERVVACSGCRSVIQGVYAGEA